MRLALAASILGWTITLPQESHAFREEIWEWETLQNQRSPKTEILKKKFARDKFQKRNLFGGEILKNSDQHVPIAVQKECDPNAVDADLGILSCGYNEYCASSDDSLLGGRCVPLSSRHFLRRVEEISEEDNATISYNTTDMNLFELGMSYCEKPYCVCSNVNEEAYTVDVTCNYEEYCGTVTSNCGVNASICFENTLKVNLTEPYVYSLSRCYQTTSNGDFDVISFCYNSTLVNSTAIDCAVSANGESCKSCEVVPKFYDVYCPEPTTCYYNFTAFCYYFDCTNVNGGWAGNDCDSYPKFIQEYGCVECSICEAEEVATFPEATLVSVSRSDLQAENTLYCGDGPVINDVTLAQCVEIELLADEVCGCVPKGQEGEPTKQPSDTTTESPTDKANESTSAPTADTDKVDTSGSSSSIPVLISLFVGLQWLIHGW
jgi:hypothetical protein